MTQRQSVVKSALCCISYLLVIYLHQQNLYIRIPPRGKTSKLKDADIQGKFEQRVAMRCQIILAGLENGGTVEKSIKNGLLEAADEICG